MGDVNRAEIDAELKSKARRTDGRQRKKERRILSWAVFLGSQSGGGRLREGAHVRARAGEGRADAQQGVVVAAADQVGGVQALRGLPYMTSEQKGEGVQEIPQI